MNTQVDNHQKCAMASQLNLQKMYAIHLYTGQDITKRVNFFEQDALMSPNPRGKLEDHAVGCVCCVVV